MPNTSTPQHTVEHFENTAVHRLYPDGVWARSEFPHELVTLDFDAAERLIAVEVLDPQVR